MEEPKKNPKCDGNSRRKLCTLICALCLYRSLASSENAYLWHESNNISPRGVFRRSEKEYNFYCGVCDHLFVSTPKNISKSGCPFCAVPSRKLCDKETCNGCYEKSLASVELLDEWSSDNELTPRQIFKTTKLKYKFVCTKEDCGHDFEAAPGKKTRCPYCTGGCRKLCEDKNCKICNKTTFAAINPEQSKRWSSKNEGLPSDYTSSTTQKFLFDCLDCGHEFPVSLAKITQYNRWCPYCAIPSKKVCTDGECNPCFIRSFENYKDKEKVALYSDKNPKPPRQMLMYSHTKCIFKCPEHGEFEMVMYCVAAGQWCPICVRKTESKLLCWLRTNYPKEVTREAKFCWCRNPKTARHFPFDFLLKERKLLIELDGAQHFKQIQNWSSPEETQSRDRYKELMANENEHSVVRLLQEDVLQDRGDWAILLTNSIERIRETPDISFIDVKHEEEVVIVYEWTKENDKWTYIEEGEIKVDLIYRAIKKF